jgi:hypothetical protein
MTLSQSPALHHIKPATEEASLGITVDSVARTPDAIPRLIHHILTDYHQHGTCRAVYLRQRAGMVQF